ncbi:unnamed protein product, partial [Musa textilis]
FWSEGRSHVLWGDRVGSVAHRVADRLLSVRVLSDPRIVHGHSCGDAGFPYEPHVLLRFLDAHSFHRHRVVRDCFVPSQLPRWVKISCFLVLHIILFKPLDRAIYLLYLVERAKKCLDFSATLYIIHLFICIIYGGWPSSITWWVVNVTGLALMSLLGEWLCIRRELQEIPITRLRSSKQSFA